MYIGNGRISRLSSITWSGTGSTKKWLRKCNESHICNYNCTLASNSYNRYYLYQSYQIQTMQLWSELDRYALSVRASLCTLFHLFLTQLHFWRRVCGIIVCSKLFLPFHQCAYYGDRDILHIRAKKAIILIFSWRLGDIC